LDLVNEIDSVLKQSAPEYVFGDAAELDRNIQQMSKLMSQYRGIGLAAPQVGWSTRIFLMWMDGKVQECINPEILDRYGEQKIMEGCLSFPDLYLEVERARGVRVSYFDRTGEKQEKVLSGMESQCFQHELDHLDGVTFDTKVSKLRLDRARKKRLKLQKRSN
jgi:peptide deformylase